MGTFRNFTGGWGGGSRMGGWVSPAIRNIVIACTGVFLIQTILQLFSPRTSALLIREFGLVPYLVTHGLRLWQPVSYLFLHGGLMHLLLLNMLFSVDVRLRHRGVPRGRQRMYSYFFLTGIGAGLHQRHREDKSSGSARAGFGGDSDHRRVGCDLRNPAGGGDTLSRPPDLALFPFPVMIPMKIYVLGAGAIEFFSTLGSTGRQRQPRDASGRHAGGLPLSAARFVVFPRAQRLFPIGGACGRWRKFEVYMRKHRDEPPSRPAHWVN